MKNIILVYPAYERGGVKINFLNYIKVLKKKKFNIFIISDKKIFKDLKKKDNVKLILINRPKISIFYKYVVSLFSSIKIFELNKRLNDKNVKIISFQSSFFPSIICSILRLKLILRVSEDPMGATYHSDNLILAMFVMLSKIITYNLSYKILTNSISMKANTQKLIFNKKKVVLQYNMNLNIINKFKISHKKNIFINVGRFCKQKNQSIILKAFKLFISRNKGYNYKLYLCGDGPDKIKLKKLCNNLELNKYVKFYSWQKDTKYLLKQSKYFLLTSLYEGLPNVLIEAMNYDLLCLCSATSGIKDICGNNYVHLKKNDFKDVCYKMEFAIKYYNLLITKNKAKKNRLKRFLFKNLDKQLLNNIK
jgi:glycosyltransferase involved in cell wall biosynthesis